MIFVCCDLKQSKVVSLNKKDGITCVRVIYVVCPRIPPKARDVLSVWFPATLIIVSKRSHDSVPVHYSSKAFFTALISKYRLVFTSKPEMARYGYAGVGGGTMLRPCMWGIKIVGPLT